jgi:hypothetical protein
VKESVGKSGNPVSILFLVFNRPDTTAKVFEQIRRYRPARLYVAADGPRRERTDEAERCARTREIATRIDWPCTLKTLFRDDNLGCKVAVSSAISWFFEHEEEGVILEDDCLPSPSFFWYCAELLERYRHNERVMHIGGANFGQGVSREEAGYYFSNYVHVWGWASWRRAWNGYDVNLQFLSDFERSDQFRSTFRRNRERRFWSALASEVRDGGIDTWDVQWFFHVLRSGGVATIPTVNLISNLGFGEISTHTSGRDPRIAGLALNDLAVLRHPDSVKVNRDADESEFDAIFKIPFRVRLRRELRKLVMRTGLYGKDQGRQTTRREP